MNRIRNRIFARRELLWAGGMLLLLAAGTVSSAAAQTSDECYELRIYTLTPRKTDVVMARFRDHVDGLFRRYNLAPVGYWLVSNEDKTKSDTLIYLLKSPSREAHSKSFAQFAADPEFKEVYRVDNEKHGKTVEKVESLFLKLAEGSPEPKAHRPRRPRAFELRVYTAVAGKRGAFLERWRQSAVPLYRKHGLQTVAAWLPTNEKDENTVVWLLAGDDEKAITKGKDAFHKDAAWVAVQKSSEAEGSLIEKVTSQLLMPVEFSAIR